MKHLDITMINFLDNLEKDNLLDDTVVMLYADHGHHIHPLIWPSFTLNISQPKMELWLPSFFISVPSTFAKQN